MTPGIRAPYAWCHRLMPGVIPAGLQGFTENAPLVGVGQMWTPLLAFSMTCSTLPTLRVHTRVCTLHAPRPNARKPKPDPRRKKLEKLIQKRANLDANDVQGNLELSAHAQIRALRAEMREPVQSQPDDISAFDFTSVRPTPTPPTDDPPHVPREFQ